MFAKASKHQLKPKTSRNSNNGITYYIDLLKYFRAYSITRKNTKLEQNEKTISTGKPLVLLGVNTDKKTFYKAIWLAADKP
ncbi:hypothetical protein TUM4261_07720 [Shewanella sp. c952]|nr:hypothetical protein TUM4261_07720 [Shewanella sp. c952]